MGRPKKPLSELSPNSYRPSRHGPRVVDDSGEVPAELVKPASLGEAAGNLWERIASLYGPAIKNKDVILLELMCQLWGELQRDIAAMQKTGPGNKKRPGLVRSVSSLTATFDTIAKRFGMTPADRAKLKVVDGPVGPQKAAVETRPKTKLDKAGRPK